MLRVCFLQQWYGLAGEAREDALYDSQALQQFVRIDLRAEGVPDATTLLKFRRLLETHDLCKGLFSAINADLTARGLLLREGILVDATLIAAPPSTKNEKKERDPEMHQTKKGNQWYCGMKAHIGADRDSKLVHPVVVTAANVADITQTSERLHGTEQQVHADAGYPGVEKRAETAALERKIGWQIAAKRGAIKAMAQGVEKEAIKAVEKAKASVRAFVEHPFHIVKNIFRHRKVRYRGLAKNGHQLYTLFGLANVVIGSRAAAT
jgi:IS5 family transposase